MSSTSSDFVSAFDKVANSLPGSGLPWLTQARRSALDAFKTLGFPSPRDENWKYTNVRPIERGDFAPNGALAAPLETSAEALNIIPLDGPTLVLVNGAFSPELSHGLDTANARIISTSKALDETPNALKPWFAPAKDFANGFAALNRAFASDGAIVRVAANAKIASPIHLVHIAHGATPSAHHYRSILYVEANAQAQIVESYLSTGDPTALVNSTTEVVLEDGAQLNHSTVQTLELTCYHVARHSISLGAQCQYISDATSLGARLARYDIDVDFTGTKGQCVLNGLYVARGRQHVDFHTAVDHRATNCTSEEYYKGILDGHGRGVFNGRVYVHPDAQKSDASQANHNLLLSANAEIDTKPQLEIYADDVAASHGATVGQLNEDALYYLRTRGLDEAHARGLLTYGFAQDVIARMAHAPVRDRITQELNRALPALATIRTD